MITIQQFRQSFDQCVEQCVTLYYNCLATEMSHQDSRSAAMTLAEAIDKIFGSPDTEEKLKVWEAVQHRLDHTSPEDYAETVSLLS